ncbi:hypothetical protein K525DRAFT_287817 [Schizophyllum commune Loenen D]|nr:hypothetical protein K525DRAFT_287817 [Schizophyllum commune Loenen D]
MAAVSADPHFIYYCCILVAPVPESVRALHTAYASLPIRAPQAFPTTPCRSPSPEELLYASLTVAMLFAPCLLCSSTDSVPVVRGRISRDCKPAGADFQSSSRPRP